MFSFSHLHVSLALETVECSHLRNENWKKTRNPVHENTKWTKNENSTQENSLDAKQWKFINENSTFFALFFEFHGWSRNNKHKKRSASKWQMSRKTAQAAEMIYIKIWILWKFYNEIFHCDFVLLFPPFLFATFYMSSFLFILTRRRCCVFRYVFLIILTTHTLPFLLSTAVWCDSTVKWRWKHRELN